jgi:hypothetical protein
MAITEQEQAAAVAFDALAGESLPDLIALAAQLHRCRQDANLVRGEIEQARAIWEQAMAPALQRLKALESAEEAASCSLREAALIVHAATHDKHPGPGVTIREHQELRYAEEEVREWCRGHLPIALERVITFKRKVFEAVVDPMGLTGLVYLGDGPLVTKETTYSVAIDRDLDKALLGEVAR